jgi:8-hydroxy-5-deazaflavin:NADPH oxidoreductase
MTRIGDLFSSSGNKSGKLTRLNETESPIHLHFKNETGKTCNETSSARTKVNVSPPRGIRSVTERADEHEKEATHEDRYHWRWECRHWFAKQLIPHGHAVTLSFSTDVTQLVTTARSLGAQSGTPAEAARFADVVIFAVPWGVAQEALRQAGPLDGKVIWDCTNALKPDFSGLQIGTTTSAGEEVARMAPTAIVVKAIPPFAEVLHGPPLPDDAPRHTVFVCGDDATAKRTVSELVRLIGAEPVDAGPLYAAGYAEPSGMLLVHLAYKQGFGGRIGSQLLRFD